MSRGSRGLLRWRQLHLALPLGAETATQVVERLVVDAHLGHLVLEARASGGRVRYLLGAATDQRLDDIVCQLAPGSRTTTPAESRSLVKAALRLGVRRASLPLSSERLEAVARAVLAAMATTKDGEELVIQVHVGRRYQPALTTGETPPAGWLELLGLRTPPAGSEAVRRHRAHAAQHRAGVGVRLGVTAATESRRRLLLQNLLGALRVAQSAGVRLHAHPEAPDRLNLARRPWRYPLTLSAAEILCLSGWPVGQADLPATPGAHPRHLPLPGARDRSRVFATGTQEQGDQRLGISIGDALLHTVLLGPTGAGKSTVMANLALADIRAGRGVLLIDPKTDLVTDLLSRVPPERHRDVVVIDPTSPTPVGLNPLAPSSGGRRPEVVADTVLATFKTLFADAWGVRIEQVLTAGLLPLARTPGATLVDLPLLLTNPAYRRRVTTAVADPLGTRQFWDTYEALSQAQRMQWIAPVLTRLQTFLIRPQLRATLGQSAPSFDLVDLLDQRRVVLVSLNKGVLGPESARLLGSLLVGQLWPLVLSRATTGPQRRHVVSVYIDEVQDYLALPGDLADALAQARSLGVAFHLAHQYRAQLPPHLRAGIDANAHNKIIFGLSATDAAETARLAPGLEATDFQLLPRFAVYARTVHHGQTQPWCLATTLPLPPATADPVELRAASASRYGQDAHEVETSLLSRLGLTPPEAPSTVTEATTGEASTTPGTARQPRTTNGLVIGRRPRTSRPLPDPGSQEGQP